MDILDILSLIGVPSLFASVLLSIYNYSVYKTKMKSTEHLLLIEGMRALLKSTLSTNGLEYLGRGSITTSELADFESLYETYHKLGGNGTATEIYERVRDLKIK